MSDAPCPIGALRLSFRVTPLLYNTTPAVQEFWPAVHRLRYTLRLRPDLPYADHRCVGNLGFSVCRIHIGIVATHAGILTSQRSSKPHDSPSAPWERSPTPQLPLGNCSHSFGGGLKPRWIFGAASLDQ